MSDKATGSPAADAASSDSGLAVIDAATLATWESMFAAVPDTTGDGVENILASLAGATSPAELDNPWRSSGLEALHDVPILVTGIRKLPSDYPGGLPYFLVVDGAIRATGEKITITTGAVSVVAQLVRAWAFEQAEPGSVFPLAVIPRIAKRPSASGYFPMHLDLAR